MQAVFVIFIAFAALLFSCAKPLHKNSLLFFFAKKKKRSKKRKAYRLPFYKTAMYHTTGSVIFGTNNKNSPEGGTGSLPAVTLPFSLRYIGG